MIPSTSARTSAFFAGRILNSDDTFSSVRPKYRAAKPAAIHAPIVAFRFSRPSEFDGGAAGAEAGSFAAGTFFRGAIFETRFFRGFRKKTIRRLTKSISPKIWYC